MKGAELAAALRDLIPLLERQARVSGMVLEVLPGATLRVRSTSAVRQKRYRDKRTRDGGERNEGVTKPVTKSVTSGARPEAPLPHTPSPLILPSDIKDKTEERTDETRAGASGDRNAERDGESNAQSDDARETFCPDDFAALLDAGCTAWKGRAQPPG